MKYLEELLIGDCYQHKGCQYVVTTDYKQNGSRLCVSLLDGTTKWMLPDLIIEQIDLFTVDKDSNIVAIKERKKDVPNQTTDLH
jgi:hypothetical protein